MKSLRRGRAALLEAKKSAKSSEKGRRKEGAEQNKWTVRGNIDWGGGKKKAESVERKRSH